MDVNLPVTRRKEEAQKREAYKGEEEKGGKGRTSWQLHTLPRKKIVDKALT